MTHEEEVEKASNAFYDALNAVFEGDTGPMEDVWSHEPGIMAMHPIGGRQLDWTEVRESWEQVSDMISDGYVAPKELMINVLGEVAFTVCYEIGQVTVGDRTVEINNRSTDIYRRKNGQWKMIYHHADLAPAVQLAIERLAA
jgi:hypothetical protein